MSVRRALRTKSDEFSALGVMVDGNYRQLNDNILQLENELYAPIRPKRAPRAGERTLTALEHRGIEYIELRTLDINPFTPLGVDIQQLRFLDLFLVWCLLKPSAPLTEDEIRRNRHNLTQVVLEGRRPGLMLQAGSGELSLREWGDRLFDELAQVAQLLDRAYGRVHYQIALQAQKEKLHDPTQTLSARLLDHLVSLDLDNGVYGRELAERYRQQLRGEELTFWDGAYFADEAHASLAKQQELEATDHLSFDAFLESYLSH